MSAYVTNFLEVWLTGNDRKSMRRISEPLRYGKFLLDGTLVVGMGGGGGGGGRCAEWT